VTADQRSVDKIELQYETYKLISISKLEEIENLSTEGIRDWLEKENKYWNEIDRALQLQRKNNEPTKIHGSLALEVQRYTSEISRTIQRLSPDYLIINDDERVETIAAILQPMFNHALPHHDDLLSENFKSACHSGDAASAIYAYRSSVKNQEKSYHAGYEAGLRKNLQSISNDFDKKASDTLSGIMKKKSEASEEFREAEEKIKNVVAAATSAITLSEPVKFWNDRKNIHNSNALKYGRYAFISALAFSLLLAGVIVYEYQSGVAHSAWGFEFTLPKTLSGIALILLISTGGIWSTRVFLKLMMANLTLETESIERSTMIKTFVAMKAVESSIAHEAELLFYTTLFRPSNNVISEESTAPEFGKLLDTILKAKAEK
jgi:hypothetical protein